jgi:farnesyl-diphosphate farnesyltransferase
LKRLDEVWAGLKFLVFKNAEGMKNRIEITDENIRFCDDMLGKVSRSFTPVIRQLPKGLGLEILIFYLTLRALDTVEDDMEAFIGKE